MNKREKRVMVTLSKDEWEAISQTAHVQGMSVAAFIRRAALGMVKEGEIR